MTSIIKLCAAKPKPKQTHTFTSQSKMSSVTFWQVLLLAKIPSQKVTLDVHDHLPGV